jgi:hypothetical protein
MRGYISNWQHFLNEQNQYVGYRSTHSNPQGKYGTFYHVRKPSHSVREVKLKFQNPLIVSDKDVYNFEGLSLEYLFWKWFPHFDLRGGARKEGMETGELIDKMVTSEAIRRGYDGIVMADLEIVDLTTHSDFPK